MTASKNPKGFTLLEVVIAMSIAALSLTTLFTIQGNMVRQNARTVATWNALVALKNLFLQQEQHAVKPEEKEKRFETKVGDIALVYNLRTITERSKLKDIKNVRLVTEKATWSFFGADISLAYIGARLVPEEMPKDEKGKA